MDKQEAFARIIKQEASRAYWVGCAIGAVGGIGLGIMIGLGW